MRSRRLVGCRGDGDSLRAVTLSGVGVKEGIACDADRSTGVRVDGPQATPWVREEEEEWDESEVCTSVLTAELGVGSGEMRTRENVLTVGGCTGRVAARPHAVQLDVPALKAPGLRHHDGGVSGPLSPRRHWSHGGCNCASAPSDAAEHSGAEGVLPGSSASGLWDRSCGVTLRANSSLQPHYTPALRAPQARI